MSYPLFEAKKEIYATIKKVLTDLKYDCEIKIEKPSGELGDFSFPCFSLASIAKKSPKDIADEIAKKIKTNIWIEKVETKGAYLNFFLNINKLRTLTLSEIIDKKEKYGNLIKKNKKVIIEHTSANPNGPLHVGRTRNPIIGDTIVRIYKSAGYDVESQFYLDDMGKQVAILAWGINNIKQGKLPKPKYNKSDHKKVAYYQEASKLLKDDPKVADEIGEIVKKSEEGHQETIEMVHKAYKPILEGINESLGRINIFIDEYIPESNFLKDKSVDLIVEKLKKSEYCGIEDGAYYLDMEPFGIQGRNTKFFFLRKDATTLYATRDIAYHIWKANHADQLINILGEDHKLESKQVEIALNLVKAKMIPRVIFYSFVSLPGGKMSTRQARVVYIDELIDECIKRAYAEVKKRRENDLSEKKMKEIAEIIGVGAIRYNIIKVQPEKDIVFKWEEALNFEGNSSPFIQYAHARACSIIAKDKNKKTGYNSELLEHISEIDLIKKLAYFPIIIDQACEGCKPHIIASYLFELASSFNQFYRDCPVLSVNSDELKNTRLTLVNATRIVLKNGLALLGITAPEEM